MSYVGKSNKSGSMAFGVVTLRFYTPRVIASVSCIVSGVESNIDDNGYQADAFD